MGMTDFASQQPERKVAWGKEAYKQFRDNLFFRKFMGKDPNSIIHRITELTKTEKGDKAIVHLVADLLGGGIVGDNNLEGRESSIDTYWQEIQIDQLRKGVKNKGRMADQKSVVQFRDHGKDKLGEWMARTVDDMLILMLSGISFSYETDGSPRVTPAGEDQLTGLQFAADVTAPSAGRHFRFDGTNLKTGDTTQITNSHVMKYGAIVDLMAEARTRRIKPVKVDGNEYFVFMCHPYVRAQLNKDADFRNAVLNGMPRSEKNPIFTGATVTMDGLIIHSTPKTFNTTGAASGSKWGNAGSVDGTRSLLLGAQAGAFADLGDVNWEEETFDYGNRQGIAIDKIFGMKKLKFYSNFERASEDFGVMVLDSYCAKPAS